MEQKFVVIKLGSSLIIQENGLLFKDRVCHLANQVKTLQNENYSVLLVVSGSLAIGKNIVCAQNHESKIFKQMIAGIGQVRLISGIQNIFLNHDLHAAQLLLTKQDLADAEKQNNICSVLQEAATQKIVTIINENDIVQLNDFGGNDFLACQIASLVQSEYLLLLTDVEGVMNIDKTVLSHISKRTTQDIPTISTNKKIKGTGSMKSKVEAAYKAADDNIKTYITSGHIQNVVLRLILDKEHIGTQVIS